MADITLIPSAKVPLVYDGENTMTTEWYRFFWNIYGFTGTGVVPVNKGGTGLTTIGDHQVIIGNANNVFEPAVFTGTGINISYLPGVINLAIGASGVTPGTYGSASQVGVFTVNQYGSITAASNTSIAISASQIVSGTLAVVRGGTGQSTYVDGELLIGNTTGNTLTKATLTASTGINITNGAGSITIANTGVLSVSGTAPVVSSGGATPAISMAAANTTTNGYLTSTDWNTFNNKAPATSGTSILYGNGSGGFSNVTIGSGISFAGGTLSATGSGGTVTAVTGVAPIASSGGTTPAISISQATTSTNGYLSSTDWNTFNNKQPAGSYLTAVSVVSANGFAGTSSGGTTPALTLSTTITGLLKGNGTAISAATSGTDYAPATSGTSILYGNGAGGFSNVTIGTGVSFAGGTLSATGTGGTVTSVAALTLGTTGTDLSSTVANSTTTPVITLNVPTASATNRGALSSTDWSTFNSKAPGVTFTTNYIPYGQGTTTLNQSAGLQFNGTSFTTTGYATATSFRPSSSTIPTNGLYLPATNAVGIATNSTNALYIDSSQNLLLGATATSRGGKIFIKAPSQNLGSNFANLQIQSNDALAANVGGSIGMGGVYDGSGNSLSGVFLTGRKENATAGSYSYYLGIWTTDGGATCVERARFDSTGYFLLGTTSATATPTNGVQLANASGTVGSIYIGHATGVGAGNYYATFSYNGGLIGSIAQSGTTAVTLNTSPTSSLTSVDANTLAITTSSTEQMRVYSTGGVRHINTISVGNATPSTSGAGITFPATQSASTDANTLDDYEEGTYTATMTPGTSGTITLNAAVNTMSYTKIGRLVTVTGLLQVSANSSPVGVYVRINLPFASANNAYAANFSGSVTLNDSGVVSVLPVIGLFNASEFRAYVDASTINLVEQFSISLTYVSA